MSTGRDNSRLGKTLVAAATLGALLLCVAPPRSQADDRAKCQQRIEKSEAKLDQAIRQHGERSPQADNWRRALNNEREACWKQNRAWWGTRDHQWHTERDWDRYDQGRIVRDRNGQPAIDLPRDPKQNN